MDPEFNPVQKDDDLSKWRYLHFLPTPHYTPQPLLVSNTEYIKRDEWMRVNTHNWSPIMTNNPTPATTTTTTNDKSEASTTTDLFSFIALGSRSTLTFYKVILPSQSQYPVQISIGYTQHHNLGWITYLKWLPNDTGKILNYSLLVIGFSSGLVSIYKVSYKGDIELYRSVIEELDSRPITFIEYSPINKLNQDYIIFISKGIGFYLYSLEKKILSTFFVKNRERITSVYFTAYNRFLVSSLDFSILSFEINTNFTTFDQLKGSQLLNLWKEDGKSLGIHSVRSSPNNLFLFIYENIQGTPTAMFAIRHCYSILKILTITKTYDEFEQSFIRDYINVVESKQQSFISLWDYYFYLNSLSLDLLMTLYYSIEKIKNLSPCWKLKFQNQVYYHAKSSFPKEIPEIILKPIEQAKLSLEIDHYKTSCLNFITKFSDIKEIQDNQKLSLILMSNILMNNSHQDIAKRVFLKLSKLFNGDQAAREKCPNCFEEHFVEPLEKSDEQGIKSIPRFSDCPSCSSPLERCSRTCLYLDTNNVFNCSTCLCKSLILYGEDIPQMNYNEIPWISNNTNDTDVTNLITPCCIYCSTNLSTKEIFDETVIDFSQILHKE